MTYYGIHVMSFVEKKRREREEVEDEIKTSRLKSFREDEDDKVIDASPVIVQRNKEDRHYRERDRESGRSRDHDRRRDRHRDRDRNRDRERNRDRDSDRRNHDRDRDGHSSSKSKELPLINY